MRPRGAPGGEHARRCGAGVDGLAAIACARDASRRRTRRQAAANDSKVWAW